MKIAIATPVLFEENSPYNHLFKDIIGGILDAGFELERHAAVRDTDEEAFRLGYSERVRYVRYKRNESDHNNIISRYIRDNLTGIREARGIRRSDADLLFEDVCYSSFWPVRAAKKKGMRIVAMVQDVWPDNAVQSSLIKENGILYRYFEAFQRYVYRNADRIICISDDMKDFIARKGIDEDKIKVIYNWGYSDDTVDIPWDKNGFVRKYDIKKGFYAVYAGNIGKMQNVELVVKAAKKLPEVDFLIIGDGSNKKITEEMASGLKNVRFFPLQPDELAAHVYSMAGVNIVPLVEGGPKTAMPSKTGIVLSCGRPVIFCFGSDSAFGKKLEQYDAGVSVSATDENELVEAIKNAVPRKGTSSLFSDRFTKTTNVNEYIKIISSCI